MHAFPPEQLALLLSEHVDIALTGNLVVGGLPLQRTTSLIVLSHNVAAALLLGRLPALIFYFLALIFRIELALLQRFSLS
jgi:hypothetical protein